MTDPVAPLAMIAEPAASRWVLLAGESAAAIEALRPAAEMLSSFGIETTTAVLAAAGFTVADEGGTDGIIVASSDATLPAALAARHVAVPVIRVPTETGGRNRAALLSDGADNLPAGPADGVFATMAIGEAGSKNAALFLVAALAHGDQRLRSAWEEFRTRQTDAVLRHSPLEL